jgi:hypothetical protein
MVRRAWERARRTEAPRGFENECLNRVWVEKPSIPLEGKRAFVTVISQGYESMLRALLDSLALHGNCAGVPFVVFCVGDDVYDALADWSDVVRVRCHAHGRVSAAVKGTIYSCSRWLQYKSIVSLEADMLVANDLNPLFQIIENGHPQNLYGCRHQATEHRFTLREILGHMNAPASDMEWLCGREGVAPHFHFNGGVLAGSWHAWRALDEGFEALNPFVSLWVEGAFHQSFSDEWAMNLVLSLSPHHLRPSELSPGFNVQVIDSHVDRWFQEESTPSGPHLSRLGEDARVLHFIAEKWRLFDVFARLMPSGSASQNPTFECRRCGHNGPLGEFSPSTVAVELTARGLPSALCHSCEATRKRNSLPASSDPSAQTLFRECEECHMTKGPCSCWVVGSVTGARFPNGHLKALCVECEKKGMEEPEQELHELAFEMKMEREQKRKNTHV